MQSIKCRYDGCSSIFTTTEPLSSNAKYTCRYHATPAEQDVFFQEVQFDKKIRSGGKPIGDHIKDGSSSHADTFGQLRKTVDSSDPYMTQGHQILIPKTMQQEPKDYPLWMNDERTTLQWLLSVFPMKPCRSKFAPVNGRAFGCQCSPCRKLRQAHLWLYVIEWYFRAGNTAETVAENWNFNGEPWTGAAVRRMAQRIRAASAGRKNPETEENKDEPVELYG
jgi:hypothetical protein